LVLVRNVLLGFWTSGLWCMSFYSVLKVEVYPEDEGSSFL